MNGIHLNGDAWAVLWILVAIAGLRFVIPELVWLLMPKLRKWRDSR